MHGSWTCTLCIPEAYSTTWSSCDQMNVPEEDRAPANQLPIMSFVSTLATTYWSLGLASATQHTMEDQQTQVEGTSQGSQDTNTVVF